MQDVQRKTADTEPVQDPARPAIVLCWRQFGPYHHDRCQAVAEELGSNASVVGIEVVDRSRDYEWHPTSGKGFRKETLFLGRIYDDIGSFARYRRLVARCLALGARYVLLCHYNELEFFAAAVTLRILGRRVYTMFDSKFDDKPRTAWRERFKKLYFLPYCGVLVSGPRARAYLRFLGYSDRRIADGYDTLSIARIRALAGADPAPGGAPFGSRHFTIIARFQTKKNIALAIEAYKLYRARSGPNARALAICGSGPLEAELKAKANGVDGIRFLGFLQDDGIARALANSLALILPSVEEQWGLVVNEALAMGVPVLVSDNVGARDVLVRTAVNGYIFEPDNAEGLARLMVRLATDEEEWRRLSEGAVAAAPDGDVARFVAGVRTLTGVGPALEKIK